MWIKLDEYTCASLEGYDTVKVSPFPVGARFCVLAEKGLNFERILFEGTEAECKKYLECLIDAIASDAVLFRNEYFIP